MPRRSPTYKRNLVNNFFNFFWTILCFIPIIIFWSKEGIDWYFYSSLVLSFIIGILPQRVINLSLISSNPKIYEKLGVKFIRKFVQDGATVGSMTSEKKLTIVNNLSQARKYLKTIAMYERFHWICFSFFVLTTILCFAKGYTTLGIVLIFANLLYNGCSILLQQYNKIRIRKMLSIAEKKLQM
ncbi:MAG TPA: hypothetical protein VFV08_15405 [Puia sp.]|nr:hypothetical protein [Puia sp.]